MKVLVVPCSLQIGGSEINAVDLAAAVQRRGHEVVLFGRPGPLEARAADLGLRVITDRSPDRPRPSPLKAQAIRAAIAQERPDLVHAYESYACTEAFYAVGPAWRTALVGTLYAMTVDKYLPRAIPVIAGTAALERDLATTRGPEQVFRLDPPVELPADQPPTQESEDFRRTHGIAPDDLLVVLVSRLDLWLKLDSLTDSIDAADILAPTVPIHLVIAGDGPAREALRRRADDVNARHGRQVVSMIGAVTDPNPAYRAADVVVGMGTSLLRGMAAGRASVVVGELGFVRPVSASTVGLFLEQGFWGVGEGSAGAPRLAGVLADLHAAGREGRAALGRYGRDLVWQRFGLEQAADALVGIYAAALAYSPGRKQLLSDVGMTPGRIVARKLRDKLPAQMLARRRALGRGSGSTYASSLATTPRR